MSEKINWVDLRRLVAQRAGVKEKEAGVFLNTLVSEMIAGLKADKSVRINGLGTFRLQAVSPRKSVNVSTGESITIEGYNKLNFSPEAGAKELIESTHTTKKLSATDDEITPLKKLGEQANEIVDILAELGQMPNTSLVDTPAEPAKEEVKVEVAKVEEEKAEEEKVEEEKVEEVKVEAEKVEDTKPEKEPEAAPVEKKEPEHKPTGVWRWIRDVLLTVVILLLLLFGGIYLLREGLAGFFEKLAGNTSETEQVIPNEDANVYASDSVVSTEVAPTEEPQTVEPETTVPETPEITGKREYTEFITTEEMHQDSRLAWMAYRYYGNKDLWVFIYEANLDQIPDPNRINVGTPIRIPKLSKEMMDVTNPNTKKAIEELQARFGK